VLHLIKEKDIIKGAHVRDVLTGKEWNIFAKVIVNATGE
jgi:glycerol-3-phosphate dehydrogenase